MFKFAQIFVVTSEVESLVETIIISAPKRVRRRKLPPVVAEPVAESVVAEPILEPASKPVAVETPVVESVVAETSLVVVESAPKPVFPPDNFTVEVKVKSYNLKDEIDRRSPESAFIGDQVASLRQMLKDSCYPSGWKLPGSELNQLLDRKVKERDDEYVRLVKERLAILVDGNLFEVTWFLATGKIPQVGFFPLRILEKLIQCPDQEVWLVANEKGLTEVVHAAESGKKAYAFIKAMEALILAQQEVVAEPVAEPVVETLLAEKTPWEEGLEKFEQKIAEEFGDLLQAIEDGTAREEHFARMWQKRGAYHPLVTIEKMAEQEGNPVSGLLAKEAELAVAFEKGKQDRGGAGALLNALRDRASLNHPRKVATWRDGFEGSHDRPVMRVGKTAKKRAKEAEAREAARQSRKDVEVQLKSSKSKPSKSDRKAARYA